ncbi:MAG: hypothetical protein HC804_02040 [Anaerolineae bacterium]|nr:hypothetical protein [Anaerolineae bacterium]
MAVIYALVTWNDPQDDGRVARGVVALHKYVADIVDEPNEPIGFEMLLPSLLDKLAPYELELPQQIWSPKIQKATEQKMQLIGKLEVNYGKLRTWWFNLEMLTKDQLIQIDERILNMYGSVACSLAATSAYLRALRLHGRDSAMAASYLQHVLNLNEDGGVGVCWPIESFEITWVLDSFVRAGFDPGGSMLAPLTQHLYKFWKTSPIGLSWSQAFPLNNVDDTTTGYRVLCQAGLKLNLDLLADYWGNTHFLTYYDELTPSVSANVHALTTLRHNLSNTAHKQLAIKVTEWLRKQMNEHQQLNDKWHVSPLYVTAHAVTAFMGWDDNMAQRCVNYLLEQQLESGGWGSSNHPNLEETSHVILGLFQAWECGLLKEDWQIRRAVAYFRQHQTYQPTERLWIGKTLYQPVGVTNGVIYAASAALAKFEALFPLRSRYHHVQMKPSFQQPQFAHSRVVDVLPVDLSELGSNVCLAK